MWTCAHVIACVSGHGMDIALANGVERAVDIELEMLLNPFRYTKPTIIHID